MAQGLGIGRHRVLLLQYTLEQQECYLYLTEKYQLYRTGGSGFHGEQVKPDVDLAVMELVLGWLLGR